MDNSLLVVRDINHKYIVVDRSGDFDLNIVIRTALCQDGKYWIGAGGGVTCESDPKFEYEETLQKAKALASVLGVTNLGEQVKR